MKICDKCNINYDDNIKFCSECGSPLSLIAKNSSKFNAMKNVNDPTGKATSSLVLGIIGLLAWYIPLFGLPITIIGLAFGVKGMKSSKKGIATAGFVLCIIGLVLTIGNAAIGSYLGSRGENAIVNQFLNKFARIEGNVNNSIDSKTVTDIDGNVYNTVTIGAQVWMAENLKTTKYRNGNSIKTTDPAWLNTLGAKPKYQWAYGGHESNVATYGRLYTWYAATDSRGICPTGWHLPTDTEWTTLTTYLGGEDVAGGYLKESGASHWVTPNEGASNGSGFTALPGGYRSEGGDTSSFLGFSFIGIWWSSTEHGTTGAWFRCIGYQDSSVYSGGSVNSSSLNNMTNAYSVRCLRDI